MKNKTTMAFLEWKAALEAYVETRYSLPARVLWGYNEQVARAGYDRGETYEAHGEAVTTFHMKAYHPNDWKRKMSALAKSVVAIAALLLIGCSAPTGADEECVHARIHFEAEDVRPFGVLDCAQKPELDTLDFQLEDE